MSYPILKWLGLKGSDIAVDLIYDPCKLPLSNRSHARPKPSKSVDRWKSFADIEQCTLKNPPSRSDSNGEYQDVITANSKNRSITQSHSQCSTENEQGKRSSIAVALITSLVCDDLLDDIMESPDHSKPRKYSNVLFGKETNSSLLESPKQSQENRNGRIKTTKSGNFDSASDHVYIESLRHSSRVDRWSNSDGNLSLESVSDHKPRIPGRKYNPTSPSMTNRSKKLSVSYSNIDKITWQ